MILEIEMGSSLSDNGAYVSVCERATYDEAVFNEFKRHPEYQGILEHVSAEQGQVYLAIVKTYYSHMLEKFTLFKENDSIGNPISLDFGPSVGYTSPTTLRYVKVLGEIENMFGSLSGRNIVEIGGGYGGQCLLLKRYFRPESYTIVDLPPVLRLQQKYLGRLGIHDVKFLTMEDVPGLMACDLVISNYAFSECYRPVQDMYISRILLHAACGYLTCNHISDQVYSRQELMQRIPCSICVGEYPLTYPGNYILVWKQPWQRYMEFRT